MARILLVEDDEMIRRMLEMRLSLADHEVTLAVNGAEGVEAALAGQFDLVLMDMHMPVMDGHTATEKLKDKGYSTPIVAVTASALSSDSQKAMQAGCDHIIHKPIGPDFEEQLNAILASS